MRTLLSRLTGTLRRKSADRRLDAEIQFHLEMLAREFQTQGMSQEEADLAARRQFGGVEQVRDVYRERRGVPLVENLLRDVHLTIRTLLRSPIFTLAVVVTLGLAIGANAAVFSILDQVVFRPLPVAKPSELVIVSVPFVPTNATRGISGGGLRGPAGEIVLSASYPLYRTLGKRVPLFQGVLAQSFPMRAVVDIAGTPEQARCQFVTANYFDLLGIKPAVGRTLVPDDDRLPVGQPVVVLAHGFWQRRLGSDTSILGQTIRVNTVPLTVVGVAPAGFSGTGVGQTPDLFAPVTLSNQVTPRQGYDLLADNVRHLTVLARLIPGATREQAQQFVRGVYDTLLTEAAGRLEKPFDLTKARAREVLVLPGGYVSSQQSRVTWEMTRTLALLMGMVALVLVIAASNVANLLLARGAARARDVAVRLALGASRWRLLQERLVESLGLALVAGAMSAFVAGWIVKVLPLVLPLGDRAQSLAVTFDRRQIIFTLVVTAGTALHLWLMSALQVTRRSWLPPLAGTGTTSRSSRRPLLLRRGLVVVQVALSLALVCTSTLLARSLYNLMAQDTGFQAEGLMTFALEPAVTATPDGDRARLVVQQVVDDLRALPGVTAASMSFTLPFSGGGGSTPVAGGPEGPDRSRASMTEACLVGPGYFTTIGMPLVAGRDFGRQDNAGAPKVAIVNESLATALFGRTDIVGEIVGYEEHRQRLQVVGVAKDARAGPRTPVRPVIYVPFLQQGGVYAMHVLLRTAGTSVSGDVIRRAVRKSAPTMAVSGPETMTARISQALVRDRTVAFLSVGFAAVAALLSGIGLFGLTSYSVANRSHEIGIRMALGAGRRSILGMIIRDVALLTAVGATFGLAAYLGVSRIVGSFLFGLSATDPLTIAAATIAMTAVAVAAGLVPARRAARLDSSFTLREE